jgi:hypothetical protein
MNFLLWGAGAEGGENRNSKVEKTRSQIKEFRELRYATRAFYFLRLLKTTAPRPSEMKVAQRTHSF